MISRLIARNFRCLHNLTVDFGPLTVLIGPQQSGKTTILEALRLAGQSPAADVRPAHLELVLDVERSRGADGAGPLTSEVIRLQPDQIRTSTAVVPSTTLSPTGDNLMSVLETLFNPSPTNAIDLALQAAVRANVGAPCPPDDTIPIEQASEGVMVMSALFALACGDMPEVLLIENPDNGLHPTLLKTAFDLLRAISTGKVGRRRQVIFTTHNPVFLNYAKPEEVSIVRRGERGTVVAPMSTVPDLDALLTGFGIGELWYLLGEQGLLEGRRPGDPRDETSQKKADRS